MKNFVYKSPLLFIIFVCGILFLGGLLYTLYQPTTPNNVPLIGDNDVVMTVGGETIYGKDMLYELSMYPQSPEATQVIFDKLKTDSIILQGAKEDGFLSLDDSFYNSLDKNYEKRIQIIAQVKRQVEERPDAIEGFVVGLWFRNNGYVGSLGLEKSKLEASKKITELRNQVASQKITIQEAGAIIKNDTSLKTLDLAYKNNAIFQFKAYKGQPKGITLNSELDDELWASSIGEVTKVYIGKAKDPNTNEIYEALYSFGEVTSASIKGKNYQSLEDWVLEKKNLYE